MPRINTPVWRQIYHTVSSDTNGNITEDVVSNILRLSRDDLMKGLLAYDCYSEETYNEWKAANGEINTAGSTSGTDKTPSIASPPKNTNTRLGTDLVVFIKEFSEACNLDTHTAYRVASNYLMYEYYGKVDEFQQIIKRGTTLHLKTNMWIFYIQERMFLLKTLRHIFEYYNKEDYVFADLYNNFLDSINLEELHDNLIKQLEIVMEQLASKFVIDNVPDSSFMWYINLREQAEIISVLTLLMQKQSLNFKQIAKIIRLFIKNSFATKIPEYFRGNSGAGLDKLMYTQIGCFFMILQDYWPGGGKSFSSDPHIGELDASITGQLLNDGIALVILAWLAVRHNSINFDFTGANIANRLFMTSPFNVLADMASCEIFKDSSFGEVVVTACHKVLNNITLLHQDKKLLFGEKGIVRTIVEFANYPYLLEIPKSEREGIDALEAIAMNVFPYDFFSFTNMTIPGIERPSQYTKIIPILRNYPFFLSDRGWMCPPDRILLLSEKLYPLKDCPFIVFPTKTAFRSYKIFGKLLTQYRVEYNYFLYLEHLVNALMINGMAKRRFETETLKKVCAGYRLVVQCIKKCNTEDYELLNLKRIITRYREILKHLEVPLLNVDLVKIFYDIEEALMEREGTFLSTCPIRFQQILFPLLKPEWIPILPDLEGYRHQFEKTIFIKVFKIEEELDDHSFVLKFVTLLHRNIEKFHEAKNFQLAGVAFMLNFIFVQHQSWIYVDKSQTNEITMKCLSIFHLILQRDVATLKEADKKIFFLCQHAFLKDDFIIRAFLQLFINEKHRLIYAMEKEPNWIAGPMVKQLDCKRMQLALLLLIMNQRANVGPCILDPRLQAVVKPVASYCINSYSYVLVELACRFLAKLAHIQKTPLLALLGLDNDQVESLFTERLRDPLERENVKIAILGLIAVCISTQDGMTAAFFNLRTYMAWDTPPKEKAKKKEQREETPETESDSISDFMVDYLQNVQTSHEYLRHPLQLGILRLLNNLWSTQRQKLVSRITQLRDFWPVMADPFFSPYILDVEVYTLILKVISAEMSSNMDKIDSNLLSTIEKFFQDPKRLREWIRYILDKKNIELMNSWKEFIVIITRVMGDKISDNVKLILIDSCLDGMTTEDSGFNSGSIISIWAQLYLILTHKWPMSTIEQQKHVMEKLQSFIRSLLTYYSKLDPITKEHTLCVIHRTIIDFKPYFRAKSGRLEMFLYYVGHIIVNEHACLEEQTLKKKDQKEKILWLRPWIVAISIGTAILALELETDDIKMWFLSTELLQRIMNCVIPLMEDKSTLMFAKIAVSFMIAYARTQFLVEHFKEVQLFSFSYTLTSLPQITVAIAEALKFGLSGYCILREWWLFMTTFVKLHCILLEKLDDTVLPTCYDFVVRHAELFKEMLCLTKFTVDNSALTLVSEVLILIHKLLERKPNWGSLSETSFRTILQGIKSALNACVFAITRHKKLQFYEVKNGSLCRMRITSDELLISVLNKLNDIVFWACVCLKVSKPGLHELLQGAAAVTQFATTFVENDFGVPRFEMPTSDQLTYGRLFCLVEYLCKILVQLSPETPTVSPKLSSISLTSIQNTTDINQVLEASILESDPYMGFVIYSQSDEMTSEKFTKVVRFDMEELSGPTTSSVTPQLNYERVKNSIESLMSLLASEMFCSLVNLPQEAMVAFRREITSETQFFFEFVRRRTGEQFNALAATPRSIASSLKLLQIDIDDTQRFALERFNSGEITDIADNHFLLVISRLLLQICNPPN